MFHVWFTMSAFTFAKLVESVLHAYWAALLFKTFSPKKYFSILCSITTAASLEILENCMRALGNETKFFVIFSWLSLKILVISYLTPGNSTCYFFNILGKSKSQNSQFCDFTWNIVIKSNVRFFLVLYAFLAKTPQTSKMESFWMILNTF